MKPRPVVILGASNYTYAEVTWSLRPRGWLGSHVRIFEYFFGLPQMVVPLDKEYQSHDHRKQNRLIRQARFKLQASIQAVDYQHWRNLKKTQMVRLASYIYAIVVEWYYCWEWVVRGFMVYLYDINRLFFIV